MKHEKTEKLKRIKKEPAETTNASAIV